MLIVQRRTAAVSYSTAAQGYISAVEAADGQSLETAVKNAYAAFIDGLISDGLLGTSGGVISQANSAIKAACIMAGARTLSGCLVPLVGNAPTNNNFVSGDYNRKNGLTGNGTTKYLNSNRAGNADAQNSCHGAIYRTDTLAIGTSSLMGSQSASGDRNIEMYFYQGSWGFACRKTSSSDPLLTFASTTKGFIGVDRNSSTTMRTRISQTTQTHTINSIAPNNLNYYVFTDNNNGSLNATAAATLSFYSIGSSLDLSLLDTRLTTLMAALAAAIP